MEENNTVTTSTNNEWQELPQPPENPVEEGIIVPAQ